MLVIPKETPSKGDLADWLSTIPGFLEGFTQVDGEAMALYGYQRAFLESAARFRGLLKSRQTGFSFACAAESLAKAHLKPEHTAIFVSYNLDDAKEKIRHAAMLYESMPAKWQKRRVTDNKTELEFTDSQGRRTRLVSLPCREPRGKGKADVYLDELPFMRNSRRIYTAAVPIISRGEGQLTLGSTPLGKQDLFYDVMEGEPGNYPHYARDRWPWWRCPEFCTDVAAAELAAPSLSTDERVAQFGTETLKAIRASLDLESFQQEYECQFIDSATAFLSWELIQAAALDSDDLPVAGDLAGLAALDVAGPLFAGYDVGRRHDVSELTVVSAGGARRRVCLQQTLAQAPFSLQRAVLTSLLTERRDIVRLGIDATGLGMQLAEELATAFPGRVEPITFTAPVKDTLAHALKIALEGRDLLIPANRDLMLQLHSVRKTVTVAGNVRLDSDHDERHHADKFWSLALAEHAATMPVIPPPRTVFVDPATGRLTDEEPTSLMISPY